MERTVNKLKMKPIHLFFGYLTIGILYLLVRLIISGSTYLDLVTQTGEVDLLADFFGHIGRFFTPGNIYQGGRDAIFPPLAYTIYYFVFRVVKTLGIEQMTTNEGMLMACMYISLASMVMGITLQYSLKTNKLSRIFLPILLLLSYPFFTSAIAFGNPVYLVLCLLLVALLMKDSENRIIRELALIVIAIAAGFKIYPAIFGLLYLKEKRYKETGRLIVYGILFFFVPFLWFGGLEGLRLFLQNLQLANADTAQGMDIAGLSVRIFSAIGLGSQTAVLIGKGLSYLYFALVMILFFVNPRSWKTNLLLVSLMIIFLPSSHRYTLIYAVIPLTAFLNEMEEQKTYQLWDYAYALLFAMVFAFWPVPMYISYLLTVSFYLLVFGAVVAELLELKQKQSKKEPHNK